MLLGQCLLIETIFNCTEARSLEHPRSHVLDKNVSNKLMRVFERKLVYGSLDATVLEGKVPALPF